MEILSLDWEADWIARVNSDAEFALIARWSRFSLRILVGELGRDYCVVESCFRSGPRPEVFEAIVLEGQPDAWRAFLEPTPERHSHHLLAMDARRSDFSVSRARHSLIRNLRVINRMFELMRDAAVSRSAGVMG